MHRGVKSIKPQAVPALHPAVVRVKEAPHEAACSSSGVSEHQGPGGRPPARSLDAVVRTAETEVQCLADRQR